MIRTSAFPISIACAITIALAPLAACESDDDERAPKAIDASSERTAAAPRAEDAMADVTQRDASAESAAGFDAGACNARVAAFPIEASPHVSDDTLIVYTSNPPSSGPHFDRWANFQELTHEVPDGHLVHSLEHGAVLLLYRCTGADCDALVPALRTVRDAVPTDPLCDPAIRTRVILAPRAANDVPVAAAAWGYVYRADCFDRASLTKFVLDHYAMAPENFCAAGQVF